MIPDGPLRSTEASFRIQSETTENRNFSVVWKFSRKQIRSSIPSPTPRRQAVIRRFFYRAALEVLRTLPASPDKIAWKGSERSIMRL